MYIAYGVAYDPHDEIDYGYVSHVYGAEIDEYCLATDRCVWMVPGTVSA